jgi:GNAT superfamily N-acetyltransferase
MSGSDIERITAFERRLAQAQATDVIDLSWGFALLQREFPLSHWHNRIAVTSATTAPEVLAAAEKVLGGAGLQHRYVSTDDPIGEDLRPELVAAGYEHQVIVTMVYAGPEVGPVAHDVRAVSLDTLRPTLIRSWQAAMPDAPDEHHRQLADRTALFARGAELTLLAVYDGDEITARADLYINRMDRIAQFEQLETDPDHRGRGYGGALARDALRRAREAGADLTFLTADLGSWPLEWYQRLGYVEVARTHHFDRPG